MICRQRDDFGETNPQAVKDVGAVQVLSGTGL